MFKMFKKKLEKQGEAYRKARDEDPRVNEFHTPLRIGLHSTIDLSMVTVDWILMEDMAPNMTTPVGDCEVTAIGIMKYIDGQTFYRIYLADMQENEFILNLLVAKNRNNEDEVMDAMILQQTETLTGLTEAEYGRYLANIGFQQLDWNDTVYERDWGDRFTEKLDFEANSFREDVVEKTGVKSYTNEYILYSRETADSLREWLFVGIEENDTDADIVFQPGYTVKIADINVT